MKFYSCHLIGKYFVELIFKFDRIHGELNGIFASNIMNYMLHEHHFINNPYFTYCENSKNKTSDTTSTSSVSFFSVSKDANKTISHSFCITIDYYCIMSLIFFYIRYHRTIFSRYGYKELLTFKILILTEFSNITANLKL